MKQEKGKDMKFIKDANREYVEQLLNKGNLTYGQLLEKTKMSTATLARHLKSLQDEKAIRKIMDSKTGNVVYQLTGKGLIEDLMLGVLIDRIGRFTVWKILNGASRWETDFHISEYRIPEVFIRNFIKKEFARTDIEPKAILEAFERKYKPENLSI
jgi:DNA-binding transcriptional ArsR family regulator